MAHVTKKCTCCEKIKTAEEFGFVTGRSTLRSQCKMCRASKLRRQREADPEHNAKRNEYRRAYRAANPHLEAAEKARYRKNQPGMVEVKRFASKMRFKQAMPSWADKKAMATFYAVAAARRSAGEDVTVDHVIPLNHPLVCGLHNEFNLQFLTFDENVAKSNKFEVE